MEMNISRLSDVHVAIQYQQYGSFSATAMSTLRVAFGILGVVITLFNTLVIVCFLVWRPLKTPPNAIIVSLAVTDLMVGCIVNPYSIFADLSTNNFFLCYVYWNAHMCLVTASLLHILALTVDRYAALSHPFWYQANMTQWKVFAVLLTIWIVSLSSGFLTFISSKPVPRNCWIYVSKTYHALRYLVPFVTMTLTIIILYGKIICITKRHIQKINNITVSGETAPHTVSEKKMLTTIGLVLGAFFISWLPFHVLHVTNMFIRNDILNGLELYSYILMNANSAMNPVIYFFYNRGYREAFNAIFCAKIKRVCMR